MGASTAEATPVAHGTDKRLWSRQALSHTIPRRGANDVLLSVILDMLGVVTAFIAANWLFQSPLLASGISIITILALVVLTYGITFFLLSLYDMERNHHFLREMLLVFVAVFLSTLELLGEFYLLSLVVPVNVVAGFVAITLVSLTGWRLIAYTSSYIAAINAVLQPRNVLVIGTDEFSEKIASVIDNQPLPDMRVVGFIGLSGKDQHADLPVLGSLESNIYQLIQDQEIDELIIAEHHDGKLAEAIKALKSMPVPVRIVPPYMMFSTPDYIQLDKLQLQLLREPAMTPYERILKRAFDITVAAVLLLLTLPMMVLVAILIKLDSPGPVFFLQDRVGEHGHKFKIYKFRSMVDGADQRVDEVKCVDENGNTIHKRKGDPRVTRIGKIIRKTSLDELPQLINVLRGEMSLVGPRPETLKIVNEEYETWQYERFVVPQGITGWWQVNGRSERPCHLSTDQDLYYIRHYSFWLDIKILLKTIPALLTGKGAF